MTAATIYLLAGAALLIAVTAPSLIRRAAVSAPMILLVLGVGIGLLPVVRSTSLAPIADRRFVEHLTEFTVIVALMGVGLALDRPLRLGSRSSWRTWGAVWPLLGVAMPLTIAGVALAGWWMLGLAPAAALLLGAVTAPTDPVLASDIQVEGPSAAKGGGEQVDEPDEVRFALTAEAGLNDGLAFPFVWAAVLLATAGPVSGWGLRWLGWELAGKVTLGLALGIAVGWTLARIAFRAPIRPLRVAESGEPLLALAAVVLAYGVAESLGGYGFLAVFACGMTLRSAERGHEYHRAMHQIVERLERLLTLVVLLLLGVAMANGLLAELTWQAALLAVLLVLVIRPLSGFVALGLFRASCRIGQHILSARERLAVAFFGVRGIGSLYYLAFATGQADLAQAGLLWSTVACAIALSIVVHGVTATPVMQRLQRSRGRSA